MSAFVLVACLVLVVALVVTSLAALVWSHRKDDPLASVVGMVAMVTAGIPAAVYGAMTAF